MILACVVMFMVIETRWPVLLIPSSSRETEVLEGFSNELYDRNKMAYIIGGGF
jgi:hypothetical protein